MDFHGDVTYMGKRIAAVPASVVMLCLPWPLRADYYYCQHDHREYCHTSEGWCIRYPAELMTPQPDNGAARVTFTDNRTTAITARDI